jgi:lipid-A-disaccharide synthase
MNNNKRNLMIIAGEVSGDMHGAALIHELKKLNHDLAICGIGGNLMKNEGAYLLYHLNRMAFLGFIEVVKHIPFVKQVQAELIDMVLGRNIDTIVLIDYPGFNLNIAEKLKSLNVKIIYYISPQIWAWGQNRVKKIKRLVDKMIVVFPFEKEIYENAGVNVEYVGHPLMEIISDHKYLDKAELFGEYNLDPTKDVLLVMPGSRKQEVEKIFPECIKAAEKIGNEFSLQVVVSASQNIGERFLFKLTKKKNFTVIRNHTHDLMKYSKFGIIKSGTSTLEAAVFQLPMVIVYKTSGLTYFIGKKLIKIKNIGMANIILNEQIVPELIQHDVSQKMIYEKSKEILSNPDRYNSIKQKLGLVKEKLGEKGASKKAAQIIFNLMNDTKKS